MKRFLLVLILALSSACYAGAQKIGYVNMETILKSIPEYNQAQETLMELSESYRNEIESEYSEIEDMFNKYQSEKANLSARQRQERENEIILREHAMKEMEDKYFGQDGLMSEKSKELMEPINEKVQAAINKVAENEGIGFIFDTMSLSGVVYKNEAYDLSEKIMNELK